MTQFTVPLRLLACPFCGHLPDINNLEDSLHPKNREKTLLSFSCDETEGGCGVEVTGRSPEECFAKWNTRTPMAYSHTVKHVTLPNGESALVPEPPAPAPVREQCTEEYRTRVREETKPLQWAGSRIVYPRLEKLATRPAHLQREFNNPLGKPLNPQINEFIIILLNALAARTDIDITHWPRLNIYFPDTEEGTRVWNKKPETLGIWRVEIRLEFYCLTLIYHEKEFSICSTGFFIFSTREGSYKIESSVLTIPVNSLIRGTKDLSEAVELAVEHLKNEIQIGQVHD